MPALCAVRVTYFQFPIQSAFFHVRNQAAAAAYVVYSISDIKRCRKCGKYVPCTRRYRPGERLWINSSGKNGSSSFGHL